MIWISWNQLKRQRHCFTQPPRPRPAAPEGNRSLLFGGFPHFRGHRQVATLATEGDLPSRGNHRFPVCITENWEWKIYESLWIIWKHMETYGNIWNHMETYGNWKHSGWKSMESLGNIWKPTRKLWKVENRWHLLLPGTSQALDESCTFGGPPLI